MKNLNPGSRITRVALAASLVALSGIAQAQSRISDGTGLPGALAVPGALFDLNSSTRGLLMTRVAITDRNTWTLAGGTPIEGMVVYNSAATAGTNGLQEGLAVWRDGQWISVDETPYMHVNSTLTGNSTLANSGATGANSIAIGPAAVASATNSLATGNGAVSSTLGSVAVGAGASVNLPASVTGVDNGQYGTAIGSTASVTGGSSTYPSLAVGYNARATSVSSTVVGGNSTGGTDSTVLGANAAAASYGTAIGYAANVTGTNSLAAARGANTGAGWAMALGGYASATGSSSIALGAQARSTAAFSIAIGSYGTNSPGANLTSATATGAIALGTQADATATNAFAAGRGAQASTADGVALGSASVSDRAIAAATGSIPAGSSLIEYNTTDRTLLGAVSVGNATSYRQITNVADGTESQDAVTVRQLSGALQSFAVTPTQYFHANSSAADSLAIGAESVAVGPRTVVNGNNGIGIGNGATVQAAAPGGIAIGQAATSVSADSVALGTRASALGVQGVALGAGSSVAQAGGVALGAASVADTAAGVAGYVPPTATDAQRIAIGATTSTLAAVSVGNVAGGQYRQITGVAAGAADSDAVNVSQLRAVQGTVAVIDQSTVHYDTNADGTVNYNSVTMGGSSATGPVTVRNVAPGVAGTDAVNVNQLAAGVASAAQYTDARVNQLQANLGNVAKDASAGTAGAMAMANLPQAYLPGKSMVAVGVASYDGQGALAIGVSKLSENGQWVIKFSGTANSRGKVGIAAGAGFHW